MRSSYLNRQNYWVLIEKFETMIPEKKACASPSINCTLFPLTLTWASTISTALSGVKTYGNLYCVGEFKKS